ncbi:hypothetical protein V6N11_001377 [Hibiscus sabdariffa]|uniref:Uncharacterized protein n=1 Tax=Hibiscus sabdariffa TaxID=183260 RepID=A0ABR2RZK5_9ROSI
MTARYPRNQMAAAVLQLLLKVIAGVASHSHELPNLSPQTMSLPSYTCEMELPDGSSDHDYDASGCCVPSLSICKGVDGKEGKSVVHCICVVRLAIHHYFIALGVHKSSIQWKAAEFDEVPVP